MSRFSRWTVLGQCLYYFLAGLWPVVSIETFEAVTGPKTDDWLVQTVGVLVMVIALALFVGARRSSLSLETLVLAMASPVAFIGVDVVFVIQDHIGRIYLVDAGVQLLILGLLLFGWQTQRRQAA